MREPGRIAPFLKKFEELWNEYPDMRFGQLVENALSAFILKKTGKFDRMAFNALLWNMEENEWEETMKAFREMSKRG